MSRSRFKFSIVIPCLNEEQYILSLLCALGEQIYGLEDFEVIVVDNRSTDQTNQAVWDYAFRSKLNLKVVHEPRLGVSIARNSGAIKASGEFLIFLDADNVVCELFLTRLLMYVDKGDFLAGTIRTLSDNNGFKPTFVFLTLELIKILSPRPFGKSFVHREIFQKSSGFDENVVLGENMFFLREIKQIVATAEGRFGHLKVGLKCSVRRFEKEGYRKVLSQWVVAYIGIRNLRYKTMTDINEQ